MTALITAANGATRDANSRVVESGDCLARAMRTVGARRHGGPYDDGLSLPQTSCGL